MGNTQMMFQNSGHVTIAKSAHDINTSSNFCQNTFTSSESINFGIVDPEFPLVGRLEELDRLQDLMGISKKEVTTAPTKPTPTEPSSTEPTPTKPAIIVVSGLGGIGKTQLVRHFININRSHYDNVVWIDSKSEASVHENIKTLATNRLGISTISANKIEKRIKCIIEEVLNTLSEHRTLLVCDDVVNTTSIKPLIMAGVTGKKPHVIITSRIQNGWDPIEVIKLKVWESMEALEYVTDKLGACYNPKYIGEDKSPLVNVLEAFPLALRQATAYINDKRDDCIFLISEYIAKYDTKEMLDSDVFTENTYNDYQMTTFRTWDQTISTIEGNQKNGRLAIDILNFIAFLDDHKNIDANIIIHLPNKRDVIVQIDYEQHIKPSVKLLVKYSMINRRDGELDNLSILRLVQLVRKLRLQDTSEFKQIEAATQSIAKMSMEATLEQNLCEMMSSYNTLSRLQYVSA